MYNIIAKVKLELQARACSQSVDFTGMGRTRFLFGVLLTCQSLPGFGSSLVRLGDQHRLEAPLEGWVLPRQGPCHVSESDKPREVRN